MATVTSAAAGATTEAEHFARLIGKTALGITPEFLPGWG
jgi:hypothetical protein